MSGVLYLVQEQQQVGACGLPERGAGAGTRRRRGAGARRCYGAGGPRRRRRAPSPSPSTPPLLRTGDRHEEVSISLTCPRSLSRKTTPSTRIRTIHANCEFM